MRYEYLALPAPNSTKAVKGQRTAAERLAFAVTEMINELAEDGWEYVRSDTLTVTDKAHRLAKVTEHIETVLVFRREWEESAPIRRHSSKEEFEPAPAPVQSTPQDMQPIERQSRTKSEPEIMRPSAPQTPVNKPLEADQSRIHHRTDKIIEPRRDTPRDEPQNDIETRETDQNNDFSREPSLGRIRRD